MKNIILALAVAAGASSIASTAEAAPRHYGNRGFTQRNYRAYGGYRGYAGPRYAAPRHSGYNRYRAYPMYRPAYGAYPYGYRQPGFSLRLNLGR